MDIEFFKNKLVLIMGLGKFGGGVDVAKFACDAGANVLVTDLADGEQLEDSIAELEDFAGIKYHLGGHDFADFERADIVVVNPAVRGDNEFVKFAREKNIIVTSQMNIFFELCPAKIVGITGANGKSTTTAICAHLLGAGIGQNGFGYDNIWLGGNIGNMPLLGILNGIGENDLVVLEISSFQLEQLAEIGKGPMVSLMTNLTANHLDRHGTFEAYCAAKENIFKLQKLGEGRPCVSIFNGEDEVSLRWYEK